MLPSPFPNFAEPRQGILKRELDVSDERSLEQTPLQRDQAMNQKVPARVPSWKEGSKTIFGKVGTSRTA